MAVEVDVALSNTRSIGGVVGVVHVDDESYIAGNALTFNHHHPNRGGLQLELSAVTLTETGPRRESSAVLDLKLRNTGGQPALLHRTTFHIHDAVSLWPDSMVGFLPYAEFWVRGALHASHTYTSPCLPLSKPAAATTTWTSRKPSDLPVPTVFTSVSAS